MELATLDDDRESPVCKLPEWLTLSLEAKHTDFDSRVVSLPDNIQWLSTGLKGVKLRLMESIPGPRPRLALQLRIEDRHTPIVLGDYPDLEILFQQGHLTSKRGNYCADWYFRLPQLRVEKHQHLALSRGKKMLSSESVIMYLAIGQMQPSDTAWRRINTGDKDNWLPGPVDGTEVLPLHGHGSGNVMLVRWNKTAAFKTRIDPRGEELLVLQGAIYDAKGFYPPNAWIRNPISAWQAWGAKAGTVIYYKNGHFAPEQT